LFNRLTSSQVVTSTLARVEYLRAGLLAAKASVYPPQICLTSRKLSSHITPHPAWMQIQDCTKKWSLRIA
jgi:hypothetical protein